MSGEARRAILSKVAGHLKRDGCLVLGAQESPLEMAEFSRSEESAKVVVYRHRW